MNAFLVYRYNIELKKGQLLEVVGTMSLMGCVPAESIYGVVQKLKLVEHKFPGEITHNLHREAGKSWKIIRNNSIAHGLIFGYYVKIDPVRKKGRIVELTADDLKPFPLIPTREKNRRKHG